MLMLAFFQCKKVLLRILNGSLIIQIRKTTELFGTLKKKESTNEDRWEKTSTKKHKKHPPSINKCSTQQFSLLTLTTLHEGKPFSPNHQQTYPQLVHHVHSAAFREVTQRYLSTERRGSQLCARMSSLRWSRCGHGGCKCDWSAAETETRELKCVPEDRPYNEVPHQCLQGKKFHHLVEL